MALIFLEIRGVSSQGLRPFLPLVSLSKSDLEGDEVY